MIEARGLAKLYGKKWALVDVSFTMPRGAVCGVLGRNGSGKSTLLRILAGVTRPTMGSASIHGKPIGMHSKSQVAYLPEVNHFYSNMTVEQQLQFLAAFFPSWDNKKSALLLHDMEVPGDARIGDLSDGHKARLKLVAAFSWASPVVILDEPFKGIDQPSRKKIIELLFSEFRHDDQTIIISTHMLDEVDTLLDEALILKDGRVELQQTTESLRARHEQTLADVVEQVTQ